MTPTFIMGIPMHLEKQVLLSDRVDHFNGLV